MLYVIIQRHARWHVMIFLKQKGFSNCEILYKQTDTHGIWLIMMKLLNLKYAEPQICCDSKGI